MQALPASEPGAARAALQTDAAALEWGILRAIAYADVFDFPLTAAEVHRYLVGVGAPAAQLEAALANGRLVPRRLARCRGCFVLPGRESLVDLRVERAEVARRLWGPAVRYGRSIAAVPFVRMVAVTGALALHNVDGNADVDYFTVTEPGRLWVAHAFIAVLKKLALLRGVRLCPNYYLSDGNLLLRERDLYTAHELAQMVPLAGQAVYCRLRELNAWALDFLPNASGPPRTLHAAQPGPSWAGAGLEAALRGRPGEWLDRFELARVRRRLDPAGDSSECAFDRDCHKGHGSAHRRRTLAAYALRLRALRLEAT